MSPAARVDARGAFPPSNLKGDLAVAAVAASLENLAVFAYNAGIAALAAASSGRCRRRGEFAMTVGPARPARGRMERRAEGEKKEK